MSLPTDAELDQALQRAGITHCFNVPYPWAPDYRPRTAGLSAFFDETETKKKTRPPAHKES